MAPRLKLVCFVVGLSTVAANLPRLESAALAAGLDQRGDATAKEASGLYRRGMYEDAAKLFAKLVVDYPDMLIFERSLGACLYHLHKAEPALSNLRNYLVHRKDIPADDKAVVERWIDEMEKLRAQNGKAALPVAPAAAAPVAPVAVVTTPTAPTPQPNPPSPSRAGSGLRIASIVTASVGGAALIAGIILNHESNSLATDLKKPDGYTPGKESDRKTYQTISSVVYGAGAACVAAGAILYIVGLRSASDPSLSLAPAFAPDYAGAFVKGAF